MNIGLDIDGVCYPWPDSIYRYFKTFKEFEGTAQKFWKYFMSLSHEEQMYYVNIPIHYLDTSPTEDVLKYLPKIAELGTIYYITNRPEELKNVTRKFFNFYDLPFKENVIFTNDKATYVRLHNIEYFLDDRGKNVDELLGITDVYLFKAVHNWDYRDQYKVIYSMKEFYELVKEKHGSSTE